tara:strand:- start:484 stop:1722 length:1239 start_codon:yes stop_codon:yes gene_type:complete
MRKKIAGLGVPLIFILPVAGFITSLFNIRSKRSAIVYVLFAMLFGYAISFNNTSADSYRYAQAFAQFDNTLDYNKIVEMYRSGELRDMYRLLLFYFISLFSSNPKVLYAFAGLIYGIFSYLSLRVFVKERGAKPDNYVFILVLIFFTYISLANINGFRFWTGGLIFFYSTHQSIIENKSRWLIGVLITPLIHYGFVLMVPLIFIYSFLGSYLFNEKGVSFILFYIFVFAFILSWILGTNAINLSFLSEADILSGAIGDRMNFVNSEQVGNTMDRRKESSLFLSVQKYFNYGIKIYVFISVLLIRKLLKKTIENKIRYTRIFSFVLFFYTIAFIATSVPSGARFLNIAHLFMLLLLGKLYIVNKGLRIKKIILWALPVFSFNILFINILLPILILTPTFWYGNLFWIILEGLN